MSVFLVAVSETKIYYKPDHIRSVMLSVHLGGIWLIY